MKTFYDVLIIGGGQAGLAAGFHLKDTGLSYAILDASARVGDSWRQRYDSLTLFTPRRLSQLPGLSLFGDADGYAGKEEFASYLETYATKHSLPVQSGVQVTRLARRGEGFEVETTLGQSLEARNVIVASGAFQTAVVPPIASGFDAEVQQLTVSEYRNPAQLPHGAVLIVGDGASGRDIAADLVSTRKVYLAGGRPRRLLPEKLFSQSIWSWLDRLGLMRAGPDSLVGRIMRRRDPFPDRNRSNRALTGMGIALTGRLVSATGKKATFSDGSSHEVETVIWAAGYKDESQWIDIPAARDLQGNITQNGGISSVPGLHFLGRPWQRNRASALIMGAGEDAKVVTQAIIHSTRGSRTEIKLQQGTRSIAAL